MILLPKRFDAIQTAHKNLNTLLELLNAAPSLSSQESHNENDEQRRHILWEICFKESNKAEEEFYTTSVYLPSKIRHELRDVMRRIIARCKSYYSMSYNAAVESKYMVEEDDRLRERLINIRSELEISADNFQAKYESLELLDIAEKKNL